MVCRQCVSQAYVDASFRRPTSEFRRPSTPFWEQKTTKRPPDPISATTGPTEMVHLSKFAGFYKESNQNIPKTIDEINHVQMLKEIKMGKLFSLSMSEKSRQYMDT